MLPEGCASAPQPGRDINSGCGVRLQPPHRSSRNADPVNASGVRIAPSPARRDTSLGKVACPAMQAAPNLAGLFGYRTSGGTMPEGGSALKTLSSGGSGFR